MMPVVQEHKALLAEQGELEGDRAVACPPAVEVMLVPGSDLCGSSDHIRPCFKPSAHHLVGGSVDSRARLLQNSALCNVLAVCLWVKVFNFLIYKMCILFASSS